MFLYWFFGTEIGSAIRATGSNENMVRSLGMNTNTHKVLGLAISNGLVALSGALVTQSQGYADVKQGTGAIVIGLASIIIGEVIFGKKTQLRRTRLVSVVVGSIIYRIIVAVVLQMGLNTDDLKLLTAILGGGGSDSCRLCWKSGDWRQAMIPKSRTERRESNMLKISHVSKTFQSRDGQ